MFSWLHCEGSFSIRKGVDFDETDNISFMDGFAGVDELNGSDSI